MAARLGATTAEYNKWEMHSQTSALVSFKIDNNVTWEDAVQFDPGDTTWDLIGATFEMDIQRNRYDSVPLLSMSTAGGQIIVDDPIQRVLHFKVSAADIQANLQPGTYVYDLVMLYDSDIRVLLMSGTVQVVQGVSYPPVP